MAWNPRLYATYAAERGRPFEDLLARARPDSDPRLVVDIGCGDGTHTLDLTRRWPGARVVGIDASPDMLAVARAADRDGRVRWVRAEAEGWRLEGLDAPIDLLVANAVLQWIPDHRFLLPYWVSALAPGGLLALQVPRNGDAPSHALMREVARRHARADDLLPALDRAGHALAAEEYLALLAPLDLVVDAWQTEYLHVLPADPVEHPVLTWVRSTGLRPVLAELDDPGELAAFLRDYEAGLDAAYPRRPYGVYYPFRRAFVVARRLDQPR